MCKVLATIVTPEPDMTLVALARQGNEQAFRELVEPFLGLFFAGIQRILRVEQDAQDAQDALQETWSSMPRPERSSTRRWGGAPRALGPTSGRQVISHAALEEENLSYEELLAGLRKLAGLDHGSSLSGNSGHPQAARPRRW